MFKINLRRLQKILDIFHLVIVMSVSDDFDDYPNNFPYEMWIDKKSKFYLKKDTEN